MLMERAKSDLLAKAKALAQNNQYLQNYLDAPKKQKQKRYQTKLNKNKTQMEQLAQIFHEPPAPILTKLNNSQPLHLPPSKHQPSKLSLEEHIQEQKRMLEQLQPKVGRPQTQPSLAYRLQQEQGLLPTQNLTQNQTHKTEKPDKIYQTDNPDNTVTQPTVSVIGDSSNADDNNADTQLLSRTPDSLADITASIGAITQPPTQKLSRKGKRQSKHKEKKLSHTKSFTPVGTEVEKVSRPLLCIYGERRITSKTALSLVQIYSQELTPEEITLLLDNREELRLTHAELTALTLLQNMAENSEDRKQYWKIQETIEKSKKQPTPVSKPESTLLEQKLAEAQEAIFGEIVENPIDSESHP